MWFQHTAARRRLGLADLLQIQDDTRFNTQPPEGGWVRNKTFGKQSGGFNTQPPEGGWLIGLGAIAALIGFNTQPPEGGWHQHYTVTVENPRFNTQPPEGGWVYHLDVYQAYHRFNTQPPEGGWTFLTDSKGRLIVSTHSRPKAAGLSVAKPKRDYAFQHTAARRRLVLLLDFWD